jgi:hypothetical protein
MSADEWVIRFRNRRTGRVTYDSKVPGVFESRTLDKARLWPDKARAERIADIRRRDYERSVFDVEVTVVQRESLA